MMMRTGLTSLAILIASVTTAVAMPVAPPPPALQDVQFFLHYGPIYDEPEPMLSEGQMIRRLMRQGFQVTGPGRMMRDTVRFPARDRSGVPVTVIADPWDGSVIDVWEARPPRERPRYPHVVPGPFVDPPLKPKPQPRPKAQPQDKLSVQPKAEPKSAAPSPQPPAVTPPAQPKPVVPSSPAPVTPPAAQIPPPPIVVPPATPPLPQNSLPIPIEVQNNSHPRIVGPTPPAYALPQ